MFSHSTPDFAISQDLQTAANNISSLACAIIGKNQEANIIRASVTESIARKFWAVIHGASILFINGQFKPLSNDLTQAKLLLDEMISNFIQGLKP